MSDEFHPREFRRSLRGAGITLAEHRVAVELCEYAAVGKPVVWPAIDTLAADCGLSRSATKRALNQLQVKGVIVCDGDRSGGRGRANRWWLIVKGGASDTLSNVKGSAGEPLYGEERGSERGSPATKWGSETTKKGFASEPRSSKEEDRRRGRAAHAAHTPPPFSSQDKRPTDSPGLSIGGPEPTEPVTTVEADDDDDEPLPGPGPEPSRYCHKHPDGTSDPCWGCADARTRHQQWEKDQQEHLEAVEYERREQRIIDGCPRCDSNGFRLAPDGENLLEHHIPGVAHGVLLPCDHKSYDPGCADCEGSGWRLDIHKRCDCHPPKNRHDRSLITKKTLMEGKPA
jgi:hypothetical protein